MVGLSGADIEQMQDLARSIERRAQGLEVIARATSSGISGSARYWDGADAASFRRIWQRIHAPSLWRCAGDLREMSETVRRNSDAQRDTSESGTVDSRDESGGGFSLNPFSGFGMPDLPSPGDLIDGVGDAWDWTADQTGDAWDWTADQAGDAWDWTADQAGDAWDWTADQAGDAWDWAGDQAGSAWDWASNQVSDRWDDFTDWGRDRLGDLANAAGDFLIDSVLSGSRFGKWIFNSGILGSVPGQLLAGPLGSILGGFAVRELVAPRFNDWWNGEANPWLVEQLFERLDGRAGGDGVPSGDLEARVPGGAFPVRSSADGVDGPNPFAVSGDEPIDVGRNAIIRSLEDTGNGQQIQADEFQVVAHENGSYTIVLPGVTDLSNPNSGLSEDHRSVRDTDWAAAQSAASASIDDNRYARMVRDYIQQNVPPGADLAIVGHSFGADTALDLASDETFNGRRYNVTHVVAAAYYSEPQLPHVQDGTQVLVLQNSRDIPVVVEEVGHASSIGETFPPPRDGIIVDEFTGGWAGAGHHQDNYIERVEQTGDQAHEDFFASWAEGGYGENGEVIAVDVSVHESEE